MHLYAAVRRFITDILEAIRKKLPDVLSRPDLEMAAFDYVLRLGHDSHRRVSKLYAWEEKKSKASRGAQTVDYEKLDAALSDLTQGEAARYFIIAFRYLYSLIKYETD